jgi:SAM-dependent methyltransferase
MLNTAQNSVYHTSAKTQSYFNNHARHQAYHHGSRHSDPSMYVSITVGIQKRDHRGRIKILDIGCGDGSFIRDVSTAGVDADFIGVDISANMLKLAKSSFDSPGVQLIAADGFRMPLKPDAKFDLIHIDSVLHHLIGKTRSESVRLIDLFCEQLMHRLSENGSLVVEEIYYASYLFPQITSSLIFYGLKLINFLHLDMSRIIRELLPGLEVNFLHQKQIKELLGRYGLVKLVKQTPWPVPKLYRLVFLRELGHISYVVTALPQPPSQHARAS